MRYLYRVSSWVSGFASLVFFAVAISLAASAAATGTGARQNTCSGDTACNNGDCAIQDTVNCTADANCQSPANKCGACHCNKHYNGQGIWDKCVCS
jgi:hypothetical protein